jgi:hypothetical protein
VQCRSGARVADRSQGIKERSFDAGYEILWDAQGFFAAVLDRLRARLRELGARRHVDADGYEYWALEPDWKPGDVVVL